MGKAMIRKTLLATLLLMATAPAAAQLGLPVGDTLGRVGDTLGRVGGIVDDTLEPVGEIARSAGELARARIDRLASFVRENRDAVEFDEQRQPAVRGEAILLDPDPAALEAARTRGYAIIEQTEVEGLGIRYARLALPPGETLGDGIRRLRKLLPGRTVTADHIHFPSGSSGKGSGAPPGAAGPRGGTVGVIDGGIPAGGRVAARRGFAKGAPRDSGHAIAIGSLLAGAGVDRIWSADVYGGDPAGGNAIAIARALGWMAGEGVPVVSISLVGPANPLLERAVTAARAKGAVVVAAVGNDGAAAPPAYPASYPNVVAVTGVDGKGRVLIEAGKARQLDYAAPGADISAVGADGKRVTLRGTSFAAPLAAARIAAHRKAGRSGAALRAAIDAEALDLGRKGADSRYGRGLLCGTCRRGI